MKAVVKYGIEDNKVELREMPVPAIGPEDVLLEVKAAGICGSDIEMWRGFCSSAVNVPVIMGHEFCGVIERAGKEVRGFKAGDRVVSETSAYICGRCCFCRTGDYNLCPDRRGFGYGTDGAFTQYVKVRQDILHLIPEKLSFEEAAITEPVCVAYNAMCGRTDVKPGGTIVVIGPGPIGLNCVQIARLLGAAQVIAVGTDVDAERLKTALSLGADVVINVQKEDAVKRVVDMTNGPGADLVVDAAGNSSALKMSLEMVRRQGEIIKIGWGPKPVGFSLDLLISKAASLRGSFSHTWDTWESVLKLLASGKIRNKPLISHVLSISEWEKGYRLVENRQGNKVILHPV